MKYPKDLLRELQRRGFRCTYRSRGEMAMVTYEKEQDGRRLELQLWADGNHRVSHWRSTGRPNGWVMDTTPTDFKTLEQMRAAIDRETTRDDHPESRVCARANATSARREGCDVTKM